jgi:predicted nucleotidyltransferase
MSAADFLFTPPMQRVLAATLSRPEQAYTMQELLALAASGRGNTQRQIEKLLASGVLKEEPRRGRVRSIRANTDFFLYPELSSIARKSFALTEPLERALRPFAAGIHEAFVFGSVAKGTDTEHSDVDLVVVGSAPLLDLSEAMHRVQEQLGRAVHLGLYEPTEWQALLDNDPVVAQIAQGPRLNLDVHGETD